MDALNLAINIVAADMASSTLKNIGGAISALMSGKNADAAKLAQQSLIGIGATAIGVAAQSVKMAGDFQEGMTTLVTGAGESEKNLGLVRDGILNMSVATGTSTKQLTDGMYMIESAGYHGADGLKVLQAAAEGAKVGNADLGQTANAVTTILTDYHLSGDQATAATNALITTVAQGKTHLQDLASSMGSVLPLASSLGISFPQVAGGIAVMTNSGMDAQRASMDLANAIRSLAAPNGAAQKSMQAVGLSAQDLKDTLSTQGLTGAIQLVEDHVGKTFPAGSVESVEAFKKIMGGATGYNVALMLGGKNMDAYKSNVDAISKSMNSGGNAVQGWSQVQGDFNFKLDQAQQAVSVLMIKLGTALLPVLGNLLSAVTPLIVAFANWISNGQNLANIAHQWGPPILVAAGAITAFFLPAMIKAGVEAVVNGALVTGNFVRSIIMTGVEGWQAAGKLAFFIGQIIATGAQAVATGAVMAAKFVWSLIQAGAQAVVTAATFVGSLIPSLISMAAEAVVAAATAIPGLVIGFGAWMIGALGAAAATIAATWPILLVIAGIALLVAAIIFLVTHWSQVTAFLRGLWQSFMNWLHGALVFLAGLFAAIWHDILTGLQIAWDFIVNAAKIAALVLFAVIAGPIVLLVLFVMQHWQQIQYFLSDAWKNIQHVFSDVESIFIGIGKSMWNGIKAGIDDIINGINFFIDFIDNMHIGVPAVDIGNVHLPAASIPMPQLPKIPLLAAGGTIAIGGRAIVGDRGPEVLDLPAGATVTPLSQAQNRAQTVINLTVNAPARSRNEAQEIAKVVMDELSRELRRSGNLVTWTSGGKAY